MRIRARHRGWFPGIGMLLLVIACAAPGISNGAPTTRAAAPSRGAPWLGVYTQALSSELRDGLNYDGDGALVTRVVSGSPADRAGIQKGDVIARVGTRAITGPGDLTSAVRTNRAGESIVLQVFRDGSRRTINAKLESRPVDQDSDRPDAWDDHEDSDSDDAPGPDSSDDDHDFSFEMPDVGGLAMLQGLGHGRLGVRVENLNTDLGSYFGVRDEKGALVIDVVKDSPASRAGLKAGDVITRVGDKTIDDTNDLIRAVNNQDDNRVAITVLRHGSRQTLQAELEKRTARTIHVRRGDGMMGWRDNGGNMFRANPRSGDQDMRRELDDLHNEIKDLKKQLGEMKHD